MDYDERPEASGALVLILLAFGFGSVAFALRIQDGLDAALLEAAAAGTLAVCVAGLWRGLAQASRLTKNPKCL
jgi:O-antigen/teichoic acid export membrane protein